MITSRRLLYLKTILQREDHELVKRIYRAQQENPLKNDWCELIKKDFQDINMTLTENEIIDINSYKEKVKANTRKLAFNDLKEMQKSY